MCDGTWYADITEHESEIVREDVIGETKDEVIQIGKNIIKSIGISKFLIYQIDKSAGIYNVYNKEWISRD